MIFSNECYLKDTCWKYHNKVDAECKSADIYCPRLFRMDFLFNEALISQKQRCYHPLHIDADGTDKEAFSRLKSIEVNISDFVSSGTNLYLHSKICGNGKTEWSLRLLQAYIGKIWHASDLRCRALFINVPRFILALKDSISASSEYIDHIKKNIFTADLVIFDEVGTKSLTVWEHEQILNLINTRIDMGKSNIYTSNLTGEELKEKVGDRLYSRIMNLSVNIELFGQDKRGLSIE